MTPRRLRRGFRGGPEGSRETPGRGLGVSSGAPGGARERSGSQDRSGKFPGAVLGASWGVFWAVKGASWSLLGAFLSRLEAFLGRPESILGPSWSLSGPLGALLEASGVRKRAEMLDHTES